MSRTYIAKFFWTELTDVSTNRPLLPYVSTEGPPIVVPPTCLPFLNVLSATAFNRSAYFPAGPFRASRVWLLSSLLIRDNCAISFCTSVMKIVFTYKGCFASLNKNTLLSQSAYAWLRRLGYSFAPGSL